MSIPSKIKIPTMTLVGVGVRTVSFLGVKVYSVAFYADLDNPNLNVSRFVRTISGHKVEDASDSK